MKCCGARPGREALRVQHVDDVGDDTARVHGMGAIGVTSCAGCAEPIEASETDALAAAASPPSLADRGGMGVSATRSSPLTPRGWTSVVELSSERPKMKPPPTSLSCTWRWRLERAARRRLRRRPATPRRRSNASAPAAAPSPAATSVGRGSGGAEGEGGSGGGDGGGGVYGGSWSVQQPMHAVGWRVPFW
jgi:uncharacterized membrane protein YgcG